MSEFHCEVVRLGPPEKHENADSLSIFYPNGYPVISKTGDFKEGDLAAYNCVDALVPLDRPEFSFLSEDMKKFFRIKAKRLRGVFSMGLLVPAPQGFNEGDSVIEYFGIKKWEPPIEREGNSLGYAPIEEGPVQLSTYDLEGLRKYKKLLVEGEEVLLHEKIHGAFAAYVFTQDRLWAKSKNQWRKDSDNIWWKAAKAYNLEEKLKKFPDIVLMGEVFGQVQDLKYDAQPGQVFLRFFDAFRLSDYSYLSPDELQELLTSLALDPVPLLYRGPWSEDLMFYQNGKSLIANHIREGFVVRPVIPRRDPKIGRIVLKMPGEDYLTRKEK